MSNVIKAAGLDLALVKPYMKSICITILIAAVFGAANKSLGHGISYAMAFISITESYTFTISEKNGMERLYGILPVSRKQLVIGRYLYTCAVGLAAMMISLAVQTAILSAMDISVSLEDIVGAVGGGAVVFTLMTVFQLPGYYAFGYIKGRFFMLVPMAAVFLFGALLSGSDVWERIIYVIFGNPFMMPLICIAAMILSAFVSVKIMQRKEG